MSALSVMKAAFILESKPRGSALAFATAEQ
jgi:hypothetical protein